MSATDQANQNIEQLQSDTSSRRETIASLTEKSREAQAERERLARERYLLESKKNRTAEENAALDRLIKQYRQANDQVKAYGSDISQQERALRANAAKIDRLREQIQLRADVAGGRRLAGPVGQPEARGVVFSETGAERLAATRTGIFRAETGSTYVSGYEPGVVGEFSTTKARARSARMAQDERTSRDRAATPKPAAPSILGQPRPYNTSVEEFVRRVLRGESLTGSGVTFPGGITGAGRISRLSEKEEISTLGKINAREEAYNTLYPTRNTYNKLLKSLQKQRTTAKTGNILDTAKLSATTIGVFGTGIAANAGLDSILTTYNPNSDKINKARRTLGIDLTGTQAATEAGLLISFIYAGGTAGIKPGSLEVPAVTEYGVTQKIGNRLVKRVIVREGSTQPLYDPEYAGRIAVAERGTGSTLLREQTRFRTESPLERLYREVYENNVVTTTSKVRPQSQLTLTVETRGRTGIRLPERQVTPEAAINIVQENRASGVTELIKQGDQIVEVGLPDIKSSYPEPKTVQTLQRGLGTGKKGEAGILVLYQEAGKVTKANEASVANRLLGEYESPVNVRPRLLEYSPRPEPAVKMLLKNRRAQAYLNRQGFRSIFDTRGPAGEFKPVRVISEAKDIPQGKDIPQIDRADLSPRNAFGGRTRRVTLINTGEDTILGVGTGGREDTILKVGTTTDIDVYDRIKLSQEQNIDVQPGIKVNVRSKTGQQQATAQRLQQEQQQKILTVLATAKPLRNRVTREPPDIRLEEPPKPGGRPPTLPRRSDKRPGILTTGYRVLIRRRGSFREVPTAPLTRQDALNLGSSIVGSTSAATFKIEATGTPATGKTRAKGNLGDFYKKGNLFIEKNSKRINTRGELQEITFKGIIASKKKIGVPAILIRRKR